MKSVAAFLLSLAVALPALAQDQDKEALKRDLLKEVEKRLKNEDERLLKDIEKVIEEELNKAGKAPKAAPKAEPRAEAPRQDPKPEAPRRKPRGYMGVKLMELSDEDKKDLGVKGGLKVAEAVEGGPGAKAGLVTDDVITTVDGRAIDSMQELAPIMANAGPGASVKLEVLRGGKTKTVTVVLAPHPADAQPSEPPKEQGKGEDDLRERVKKFLDKKEAPQDPAKPRAKKPAPAPQDGDLDDLLAIDEDTFDQFKDMFEKFGVDPEQFFEKGKDNKYRLNDQMKEMFKNFNLDKFKNLIPKEGEPEEAPLPAPKKSEPRKAEPRKAEPKAPRAWLGLQPEDLPEELRAQLDLAEGEGLLISEVKPGSPAEQAGLKKNDILTKIDGKTVKGEESLASFMSTAKIGQEVTLTVLRKSKEQKVKVTVGEKRD
ncbi:MAG: PDZ domain-containing protein [Planctomycetaceae bacterium]|nr:PDZ domain-containing protein [Planctomycetaceae bacterium]